VSLTGVVNDGPFDRTAPLCRLLAPNAVDLTIDALERADEIAFMVGEAVGGAVVDADRHRVGVETHEHFWAIALR
jgi:hypothetical protein